MYVVLAWNWRTGSANLRTVCLVPYPFLDVSFKFRVPVYLVTIVLAYGSFRQLNSLHSGQPILGQVEAVQTVVEPKRGDKMQ